MNYLARIESLHPDIIEHFIETGESRAIPEDLQMIIKQLTWSVEIWETERNITRASKLLKMRVKAKQGITLGLMCCKQRINDSKLYFNVDCTVSNKYWLLDAADKFEDLVKLAVAQDKLQEAGRFHEKATEYRVKANAELSMADMQPPIFLISDKMNLEELGFEKKNLKEIARKHSDGFYVGLITQLPIDKSDKRRLMYDAGIEDAKIIEETDDNGPA
ncbi:MAG: hypothetical protein JZU49_00960 [Sulfuricurvum sp.]|nr:hypothetical protein [Sulfuricurvum sp.]